MRAVQFIGRQAQLETLKQHLLHVMSGQPRVVLVEGFAGVGKTRLLAQVQRLAIEQGFQVSAGRCDETLIHLYTPFADLLSRLEEPQLSPGADVHGQHTSGPRARRYVQQEVYDVTKSDKLQRMASVAEATLALARRVPMLLIVDDLQWADRFSLDLFNYLAFATTTQRTTPLLLVGSYRPVSPATPVGRVIRQLGEEAFTQGLTLSGLDETETRVLLRALSIRKPTQQLVRMVLETTHGIPLYIEEMVHHLIQRGALYTRGGYLSTRRQALETIAWPADPAEAMACHLDMLPPETQRRPSCKRP